MLRNKRIGTRRSARAALLMGARAPRALAAPALALLALWASLFAPQTAHAEHIPLPFVVIDALPAAGGFVVYEVGIGFEDGLSGSVASCNAVFQGPFNQLLGLAQSSPQDVDKEEFAAAFDGLEGYDEELDSWFRTLSFPQPFPNGGEVGSMTYSYRAGTGGGSMITDFVPLAHLVLPAGEFFSYDLEICRDGDCFVLLPEPAAAELRLAALLAVAVLARRATGRHARARALG